MSRPRRYGLRHRQRRRATPARGRCWQPVAALPETTASPGQAAPRGKALTRRRSPQPLSVNAAWHQFRVEQYCRRYLEDSGLDANDIAALGGVWESVARATPFENLNGEEFDDFRRQLQAATIDACEREEALNGYRSHGFAAAVKRRLRNPFLFYLVFEVSYVALFLTLNSIDQALGVFFLQIGIFAFLLSIPAYLHISDGGWGEAHPAYLAEQVLADFHLEGLRETVPEGDHRLQRTFIEDRLVPELYRERREILRRFPGRENPARRKALERVDGDLEHYVEKAALIQERILHRPMDDALSRAETEAEKFHKEVRAAVVPSRNGTRRVARDFNDLVDRYLDELGGGTSGEERRHG